MHTPADLLPFSPSPWLPGGHAQTLLGALRSPTVRISTQTEILDTRDGDRLHWHRLGDPACGTAVLLLHGLEGSLASPYAPELLATCADRGWCAALVHARGSASVPNRLRRGYHSGDWSDAAAVAAVLRQRGARRIAAIGVSLGGNQLLCWLGDTGEACALTAAVAVSVPYDLAACAEALSQGISRIYQQHLVRQMIASAEAKIAAGIDLGLDAAGIRRLRSFRAFDDALTAPANGFRDVAEYYRQCSSRPRLAGIRVPTLLLHADDDPFLPRHCWPDATQLPTCVHWHLQRGGGHVGFLAGWRARPWLPTAVSGWLAQHLAD